MRKLISFSGLCFLILRLIYFFPFVITFLPYSKSIWIRFRNGKWNNSSLFCFCTSVQQLVHQHCVQEAADTKTWFIPLTNAISDTSTVSKIWFLFKLQEQQWTIFFFFFLSEIFIDTQNTSSKQLWDLDIYCEKASS